MKIRIFFPFFFLKEEKSSPDDKYGHPRPLCFSHNSCWSSIFFFFSKNRDILKYRNNWVWWPWSSKPQTIYIMCIMAQRTRNQFQFSDSPPFLLRGLGDLINPREYTQSTLAMDLSLPLSFPCSHWRKHHPPLGLHHLRPKQVWNPYFVKISSVSWNGTILRSVQCPINQGQVLKYQVNISQMRVNFFP